MRCVLLHGVLAALAHAQTQKQGFGANGQPAPQPLDDVIMQVFDKDHNGKITLSEVTQSMDAFAAMGSMGAEPGKDPGELTRMINSAKDFAPTIFNALDADSSKALSKSEVKFILKLEAALKSGDARDLARQLFVEADKDSDDVLSEAEIATAISPDGGLDKMVELVHAMFPFRKSADDLRAMLIEGAGKSGLSLADGIKVLDADGDGSISRKEVGKSYSKFKTLFLKATQTLQTMGPMLAMFGGMGGAGGPGGGGLGGLDLGALGAMGGGRGRGRGRGRG